MEVRKTEVEKPVTKNERRIDKRRPRLRSDNAIFGKCACALEAENRLKGGTKEHAVDPGWAEVVAETQESLLNVLDAWAAGPAFDRCAHWGYSVSIAAIHGQDDPYRSLNRATFVCMWLSWAWLLCRN